MNGWDTEPRVPLKFDWKWMIEVYLLPPYLQFLSTNYCNEMFQARKKWSKYTAFYVKNWMQCNKGKLYRSIPLIGLDITILNLDFLDELHGI